MQRPRQKVLLSRTHHLEVDTTSASALQKAADNAIKALTDKKTQLGRGNKGTLTRTFAFFEISISEGFPRTGTESKAAPVFCLKAELGDCPCS